MAATTRVWSWALLVFAMLVLGCNLQYASAKVCPLYCIGEGVYMTCPSSGSQKLEPACNCCLAPSGCKLYRDDGTLMCTAT
ncbi:hypothetical protein Pfo_021012 [Paulownia fortunei]|nr:hypothetical protein Pfo_021012 [Paulownia fortunei]